MESLRYHFSCVGDFWRTRLHKVFWVFLLVLVVSAAVGFLTCRANPDITNLVIDYFMSVMEESGVFDETGAVSVFSLLLNNWLAMLFCILYGFLPFLFLPVLILFSNAYLIGVMGAYYVINGVPVIAFFAGILPHGIFELPALVLAASMGFTLCLTLVKKILRAPNTPPMTELLSDILRTLLLVILPMLVAAAVIEAYVTPLVMSLFL